MGNQYSEQYYIDKIDDLETEIEDTNNSLKQHRKCIKTLNSKIDLLTIAMEGMIQKSKQTDELTDTLFAFKEFFESNPHLFRLEEKYDENYNSDEQSEEDEDDNESEQESKTRKQPMRRCKHKPMPKRIQPKRKAKKATQPKSLYR